MKLASLSRGSKKHKRYVQGYFSILRAKVVMVKGHGQGQIRVPNKDRWADINVKLLCILVNYYISYISYPVCKAQDHLSMLRETNTKSVLYLKTSLYVSMYIVSCISANKPLSTYSFFHFNHISPYKGKQILLFSCKS